MEIDEEAEKPPPPTPRRNQRNRKKRFSNLNDAELAKKVCGEPEEWKPPQKRKVARHTSSQKPKSLFFRNEKE